VRRHVAILLSVEPCRRQQPVDASWHCYELLLIAAVKRDGAGVQEAGCSRSLGQSVLVERWPAEEVQHVRATCPQPGEWKVTRLLSQTDPDISWEITKLFLPPHEVLRECVQLQIFGNNVQC
jgi:hypothetical protein